MKLKSYCKFCNSENSISSRGILTRKDLQKKVGNEITSECRSCKRIYTIHINRVFAKESKTAFFAGILIGSSIVAFGVFVRGSSALSFYWASLVGACVMSAGFFANLNSNSRSFNKLLV